MSFIGVAILGSAAIGAGASIFGSMTQANAAEQAQQTLANQQGMTLSTIQKYLQPYSDFGQQFMPTVSSLMQPGPNQTDTLSKLPGFQFARDTGAQATANAATTRGLGGNAMAAEQQFGTGLAQQFWGQYIDRLLAGTGIGANAAGTAAGASANTSGVFGPAIAQTQIGQGNALAGGAMGVAGAASGGVNNYLQMALLSKLAPGVIGGQNANQPIPIGGP